jgi:hypothetical protein
METIVPAIILLAIIGFVVGLMIFINNRDRKRDAIKKSANDTDLS